MTVKLNAMNARESARSEESPPEPSTAASLGKAEDSSPSQPEQEPIRSTALSRNITACQHLIEQTDQKIESARRKGDPPSAIATLQKEKRLLIDRKASLQRLHENEMRKSTL